MQNANKLSCLINDRLSDKVFDAQKHGFFGQIWSIFVSEKQSSENVSQNKFSDQTFKIGWISLIVSNHFYRISGSEVKLHGSFSTVKGELHGAVIIIVIRITRDSISSGFGCSAVCKGICAVCGKGIAPINAICGRPFVKGSFPCAYNHIFYISVQFPGIFGNIGISFRTYNAIGDCVVCIVVYRLIIIVWINSINSYIFQRVLAQKECLLCKSEHIQFRCNRMS